MKQAQSLKFSKGIPEDIKLIAIYKGIKPSDLIKQLEYDFNYFIKRKKNSITKHLEGEWILGRITDSEFKKLVGRSISKSLINEKALYQKNAEIYKGNARKALLMNIH